MGLLVVGSVAYDSVETSADKVVEVLGGSATFFSMASSLFAPTYVVAVIGEDFRESELDRLRRRGVDVRGIERVPGATFRWGGRYSPYFTTRDTLFTELNVFSDFQPKIPAEQTGAELVFLANIHPALQLDVLNQMKGPRFVALDTMGFWITGEREKLLTVLKRIDALFLNDEEAFALSECGNLVTAARRIQAMGPKILVVKRGEFGSVLFYDGHALAMPAVMLEHVVDPTGAGDTFAGGFMGYLASQPVIDVSALQGAMVTGTVAASFCVEGFSIDALERADLAALAQRHQQLRTSTASLDMDLTHARDRATSRG
ncbi:MAG: PfkB family carbohydrate kinase [Myxococcota bacterium]